MTSIQPKNRATLPVIAVLGCGGWGANHLRVWHELGQLAVACDVDPKRLSEVRDRFPGVRTVEDARYVFDAPNILGVVIASPAPTHADLARRAMEAGKDVLIEKPMALAVTEGQELLEFALEHGRILMVGHVLEYHPAVLRLGELAKEGDLGRLRYIYANRLNFGRIRTEESALWSFAPHDVAVVLRLLGSLPTQVACHGGAYLDRGVADVTLTHLQFPGGIQAHIHVSWLHPFKEHRLVVIGDQQMAVFDDMAPWSEKLLLYEHAVDWMNGQVPVARKAAGVAVPLLQEEPLRRECEAFLQALWTREPPLADGASGVDVLRVLEAAQRSFERAGVPESSLLQAGVFIHPTATVDAAASLGRGTKIWHFTHVMGQAQIGPNCTLGQNVFVGSGAQLGAAVKVQNNVSIYEGVVIEDDVFCGPSVVFTNVRNPRAHIERKDEFARTLVRKGSTIGANATVVCGVTIGRYAMVGAGAVVTRDIPAHALVLGSPARTVGWVCTCGIRLTEDLRCPACGAGYCEKADGLVKR